MDKITDGKIFEVELENYGVCPFKPTVILPSMFPEYFYVLSLPEVDIHAYYVIRGYKVGTDYNVEEPLVIGDSSLESVNDMGLSDEEGIFDFTSYILESLDSLERQIILATLETEDSDYELTMRDGRFLKIESGKGVEVSMSVDGERVEIFTTTMGMEMFREYAGSYIPIMRGLNMSRENYNTVYGILEIWERETR